jgi:hypothetical protein
MRGLQYTGEGRLTYHPPLDETEDAKRFCPHCYGSLDRTRAPTILPPPWFDHGNRQIVVGGERRRVPSRLVFRLLLIFWERRERLLSNEILMDLLYESILDDPPDEHVISVYVCHLRKLIDGTPYSILNLRDEGHVFTTQPPGTQEIRRIARRKSIKALA